MNTNKVQIILALLATLSLAYASVQDTEAMYTAEVQVAEPEDKPFFTISRAHMHDARAEQLLQKDGSVKLRKAAAKESDEGFVASLTNSLETSAETKPRLEKDAPFERQPKQNQPFVEEPREQRAESLADGGVKIFKDKMLVRVHSHPKSPKTVDSVVIALEKNAQLSEDRGLDVWAAGPGYMDIMVSQHEANKMEAAGHVVETLINDVQQLVDDGSKVGTDVHPLGEPLDLAQPPTKYLRLADLHKYYKDLSTSDLIQTNAKWIPSVGKSTEGRDIGALRFGGKNSNDVIFFQAGIHAREWISPSTVLHVTHKLLTSKDKKIRDIVNNIEFVVVPSLNPDGYEYTHTANRLWRKNRADYGACKGVDLNRNWDDHWGAHGASHDACSETFAGKAAFSEKETQVARDLLLQLTTKEGKNVKGAIDWHSYSQIVLRPYDWAKPYERKPKNEEELLQLGQKMADIMSQGGKKYTTEHASELYRVAGSSMAWQYAVVTKGGAAYTVELRDKGNHGFVLPASEILPVASEVFPAVQHFADTLVQQKFDAAYASMEEGHLLTEAETLLEGLDKDM